MNGPRTIQLAYGTAIQWMRRGDHPCVGLDAAGNAILFGRKKDQPLQPGDYILSPGSGRHQIVVEQELFEEMFRDEIARYEIEAAIADAAEVGMGVTLGGQHTRLEDIYADAPKRPHPSQHRIGDMFAAEPKATQHQAEAGSNRVSAEEIEKVRRGFAALTGAPRFAGRGVSDLTIPSTMEEAIRSRDAWYETAAQHLANEEFYRGIVRQIGDMFGDAAKTSDDGSLQQDVLALKVPELVLMELELQAANHAEIERLNGEIERLTAALKPGRYTELAAFRTRDGRMGWITVDGTEGARLRAVSAIADVMEFLK